MTFYDTFTTPVLKLRQDEDGCRKALCFGLREVIGKWGVPTGWLSRRRDTQCRDTSHAGVRQIHNSTALFSVSTAATCSVSSCGSGRPPGCAAPAHSCSGLLRSAPAPFPEPVLCSGFTAQPGPGRRAWPPAWATGRLCCGVPRWQATTGAVVSTACRRTRR